MLIKTSDSDKMVKAASERKPFKTHGALRGEPTSGHIAWCGRLPTEWRASFDAACLTKTGYVIYSYSTPIGWTDGNEWTVPHTRYSVTTSQHQNAARYVARMLTEHESAA